MHLTTNAVRRPESTTTQIEKETVALHPFPPFVHSRPLSIPALCPFPPFKQSPRPSPKVRTLSARLEIKTARITGLAFSKLHVCDSPGLLHPSSLPINIWFRFTICLNCVDGHSHCSPSSCQVFPALALTCNGVWLFFSDGHSRKISCGYNPSDQPESGNSADIHFDTAPCSQEKK